MKFFKKYIILVLIIFFITDLSSAENIENETSQNLTSLWLGWGFGVYFASEDIHDYLKEEVEDDSLSLYFSLSVKASFDLTPLSWLNISTVGEAYSGCNFSGNLDNKHFLNRLSIGLLPGYVFTTKNEFYIVSFGVLFNNIIFEDHSAPGIGYRFKFSFIPFMKKHMNFPTTKGFIIFDYIYTKDDNFELGAWGFQIGSEFMVF